MSDLPSLEMPAPEVSIDDAFPAASSPPELSIDEAFPKGPDIEKLEEVTRSFYAIGEAFKHGFGDQQFETTQELLKFMRDKGVIKDWDRAHQTLAQEFADIFLAGPIRGLDYGARTMNALIAGASQFGRVQNNPFLSALQPLAESFPAGHELGFPRAPSFRGRFAAEPKGVLPPEALPWENQRSARTPQEALNEGIVATPEQMARELEPQLFRDFEDTIARRDALASLELDLRTEPPPTYNIGGVEVPAETRLSEVRPGEPFGGPVVSERPPLRRPAGPEIDNIRASIEELNAKIDEMRPKIAEAQVEAEKWFSTEPEPPAVPPLEEKQSVRFYRQEDGAYSPEPPAKPTAFVDVPPGSPMEVAARLPEAVGAETPQYRSVPLPEELRPQVQIIPADAVEPQLASVAQRRLTIRQDAAQKLQTAGYSEPEARTLAPIVEAYYNTRAARMQGRLGSGRDIYEREAPRFVQKTTRSGTRGRTFFLPPGRRNVITLFQNADVSTALHELGHNWLEDFHTDATHPQAPPELVADWNTVREFTGWEEGQPVAARKRAHERFAEEFERYFKTGETPNPRLRRVFEQLKDWLTKLYLGVKKYEGRVSPEMQKVFDRMLTDPERLGTPDDFAKMAREASVGTSIEDTPAVTSNIQQTRDAVASERLPSEMIDERLAARRGEEGNSLDGNEVGAAGPTGGSEGDTGPTVDFSEGRAAPEGKAEPASDPSAPIDAGGTTFLNPDGTIRVENLFSPDDIRQAFDEAKLKTGRFTGPRRDVLTDAEAQELANELGVKANIIDRWQVGRAFNVEEVQWLSDAFRASIAEVKETAKLAIDEQGIINHMIAFERNVMLQEVVMGVRAELGRAFRALRGLHGLKGTEFMQAFSDTTNMTVNQARKQAAAIAALETQQEVAKYGRNVKKPGAVDMVMEGWTAAIMATLDTQLRNLFGGTTVLTNAITETVRVALQKVKGQDASFAEVADQVAGAWEAKVHGFNALRKSVWDEDYNFLKDIAQLPEGVNPDAGSVRGEFRYKHAIPGVAGKIIRSPFRAVGAPDNFFKALNFYGAARRIVGKLGREQGLTGEALRDYVATEMTYMNDAVMLTAWEEARYHTFQSPLPPGMGKVAGFINDHPIARLLMPFPRSYYNMFKYAGDHSPMAILFKENRDILRGLQGAEAKARTQARMIVGSTVMAFASYWALNDALTDGGPADPQEAQKLRAGGWLPYGWRIGNMFFSIQNLAPWSLHFQLAADLAMLYRYSQSVDPELEKGAEMVAALFWRNVGNSFGLEQAGRMFDAARDPHRNLTRFLDSFVASFVPNTLNPAGTPGQLLNAAVGGEPVVDPYMRETRDFLDALKARDPFFGYRQTLPIRVDRWGRDMVDQRFGPQRVSTLFTDPIDDVLHKLGMNIATPDYRLRSGVELTREQHYEYAKLSGQFIKRELDKIVNDQFRALPPAAQRKKIASVVMKWHENALHTVKLHSVGTADDIFQKEKLARANGLAPLPEPLR